MMVPWIKSSVLVYSIHVLILVQSNHFVLVGAAGTAEVPVAEEAGSSPSSSSLEVQKQAPPCPCSCERNPNKTNKPGVYVIKKTNKENTEDTTTAATSSPTPKCVKFEKATKKLDKGRVACVAQDACPTAATATDATSDATAGTSAVDGTTDGDETTTGDSSPSSLPSSTTCPCACQRNKNKVGVLVRSTKTKKDKKQIARKEDVVASSSIQCVKANNAQSRIDKGRRIECVPAEECPIDTTMTSSEADNTAVVDVNDTPDSWIHVTSAIVENEQDTETGTGTTSKKNDALLCPCLCQRQEKEGEGGLGVLAIQKNVKNGSSNQPAECIKFQQAAARMEQGRYQCVPANECPNLEM